MTTFEKAMTGDEKSIEQFFFGKNGSTRSEMESRIIFNFDLHYKERLRRVSIIRAAQSIQGVPSNETALRVSHVSFDNLIIANDTHHTRSVGIQLD